MLGSECPIWKIALVFGAVYNGKETISLETQLLDSYEKTNDLVKEGRASPCCRVMSHSIFSIPILAS